MERSWIFLMIVMVVALAHLQVGEKAAAEDNGDVKGLASLDHAGKSFFQEKPLEKNHNAEDENVRHRWHQNAGEIRRRAIRQSERWTNEDKQKGRRIRKQQAVKEKRRRSGSDEYHRRRRDVHNNKQNMKGGKRRHRGDSDSGQGRRRKHRGNSLNRGRKEKFVRPSEKPQNSRRSVPIDSERRRTNRDPDNFYSREGQGKGVRRRKEKRRRPKIDGKGKKRGTKKDDDMKEKLNKKKASSRAKSAKSTGPKRKKVKKMKIILGKGGKKAIPKGSCKVSRIVSAADGNSAILFGYNMQKKGSCKMTFKAPKGSTLSLDCPQFDLNSKGCDQEGMQVYDKASKKNSEHCLTSGPKDWKSSGNVAAITFRREASKDKCGRNFVCQITVTGSPQTVKMLGRDGDCDKSISLSTGESAAIYTINGPKERNCKINLKGPKGTIFNITCPLLSMDGEYCSEQVVIEDEGSGSYGYESACAGDKDGLTLVTESHMASVEHDRQKDQEKNLCSAGFVCVASVVDWWNTAAPVQDYNPEGYKTSLPLYPHPNSACPSKDSMTGDNAKCELQCRQDEDCPQLYYCCPNGCGRVCVPPEVTGTDSCGCSVTFLTQSGSYYDYYSTDDDDYSYSYDEFYYAQEAQKEEAILMNFVLATVNESFTPSMEPHVITPEFKWSSLGHYESLCQLQRSMTPFDAGVRYDVFKKPTRKLFIITKKSKTLERVSDANLKGTYSVICLLTIGSARPNDALLSQLTKKVDGSPCHWEVERYHDLYGLLPQIKDFINDGSCKCPGESLPVGPCTPEGGVCKVDADCGGHPMICDRGTCRKKNLYQPQTFSPQHDEYLNFFSYFYDYPLEDYSYLKSHAGAFASEYDYFLDGYDDLFQDEEFYKEFDDSLRGKDWLSRGEPTRYHYVDLPVEIKYPENGYCGQDYYQCSGVYTICVSDKRVCDGTPDCPHQDDESDEACAKRNCDEEWFQCKSGECIPKERACNGARDCPDGSDEYCEDSSDCPPFRQHYCQSGECISHFQICDGRPNCKNAEDERGCMCKGFRCSSGECVYHSRRCDGRVDCSDGSDEICTNFTCPEYRPFKCAGGGECIRRKEVCNSVKNCPDGSDERTEVCNPSKCFYCSSGNCIPRASVCNGQDDCDDRSDELNCRNFSCRTGQFHCASGACLPEAVLCNGREECPDGSDEFACSEERCPDSRPLFCSSGECIPSKLACNGFFDCQDRSDESKCPNLPCLTGRGYKCNSGQCLPSYLSNAACDRRKNCKDGSDELNCDNPPCPFKCGSGECIGNKLLCNGFRNCADGSDEENCEGVPCNGNQFRCGSGECLESARRCDGGKDCNDGSDEENCQTYQCPKGSFKCGSGECFPKYKKCDFSPDCRDASDEEDCQNKARCFGENEIHCKSGKCIDKWRICDGYADCSDGSDEAFCSDFQCPFYRPFQCASGECRRAFHRCDGFVSCADASDEDRCGNFTCPDKRPFPCPSGECLTYYQVCNGYEDCSDGSDEKECDSFSCPGTTFQCKAGNCLPLRFVCDKDRDCPDGDDELNCDSGM